MLFVADSLPCNAWLGDESLDAFYGDGFSNLRKLHLSCNDSDEPRLGDLPALEVLALNSGYRIDDEGVEGLSCCDLPSLRRLSFGANRWGDEGMQLLVDEDSRLTRLQVLLVWNAWNLGDGSLVALANGHMHCLQRLVLTNSERVTDAGVEALANTRGHLGEPYEAGSEWMRSR